MVEKILSRITFFFRHSEICLIQFTIPRVAVLDKGRYPEIKTALLLDFVQMGGGEGPCPNFLVEL